MKNTLLLAILCVAMFIGCSNRPDNDMPGPEVTSVGVDFRKLMSLNRKDIQTVKDSLDGTFVSENTEILSNQQRKTLTYTYSTNLGIITLTHVFYDSTLRSSWGYFDNLSPAKALACYTLFSGDIFEFASSSYFNNGYGYTAFLTKGKYLEYSLDKFYGNQGDQPSILIDGDRNEFVADLNGAMKNYKPSGKAQDSLNCRESWNRNGHPMGGGVPTKSIDCSMYATGKNRMAVGFSVTSDIK